MRGPNFPCIVLHVSTVWWLREASQIGQDVKKSFKVQQGRILINPAILGCNWKYMYHFIAKKQKLKIKNANARVWGDAREDQKPKT